MRQKERKKREESQQIGIAADEVVGVGVGAFVSSSGKRRYMAEIAQFARHFGTIEGHRMSQNLEEERKKKIKVKKGKHCTQRSLPAGTDTHQGSSRLSKSSN